MTAIRGDLLEPGFILRGVLPLVVVKPQLIPTKTPLLILAVVVSEGKGLPCTAVICESSYIFCIYQQN